VDLSLQCPGSSLKREIGVVHPSQPGVQQLLVAAGVQQLLVTAGVVQQLLETIGELRSEPRREQLRLLVSLRRFWKSS